MEAAPHIDAMDEQSQLAALAPLNIIRTETVLSKLPVHHLAKKGKVDIQILKRGENGDVQLKWEVSHNDRYGQPRQLAYKLDTIVVNRRIDETRRPLPTVIRIGSLKEICRDLELKESGKTNKDLRNAFLQNASAFINAQLTYRTADGVERRLEAGFTRYGVVFTGEKLPDGRQADCVYIVLNQPYWDVVNHAPIRPLNYDYLKSLTPGAQRFYEILSFRIFAALKHSRPQARILYSDYCAYSAQQRYFDHEHFRVQMYKLHRPHIDSGYLKAVSVESTTDGEGKPDWLMFYTPGPKARAEFQTFCRKQKGREVVDFNEVNDHEKIGDLAIDPAVLEELTKRGIRERTAKDLLRKTPKEQRISDQLEWGDYLVATASCAFRNPPGFYISLIRDNLTPPESFETSRKRKLHEEAEKRRTEETRSQRWLESQYEDYLRDAIENAFLALSPEDRTARVRQKRKQYAHRFPNLFSETLDDMAVQGAKKDLQTSLDLKSFNEFTRIHSGPNAPNAPNGQNG